MPLALCAWDGLAGYDLRDDKQKGFTPFDLEGRLVGLVCHAACYTLLAQQLRYRLKLRDVQQLAKNKWQALLMQGDYGGMLHHQDQVDPGLLPTAAMRHSWHVADDQPFCARTLTTHVWIARANSGWWRILLCASAMRRESWTHGALSRSLS